QEVVGNAGFSEGKAQTPCRNERVIWEIRGKKRARPFACHRGRQGWGALPASSPRAAGEPDRLALIARRCLGRRGGGGRPVGGAAARLPFVRANSRPAAPHNDPAYPRAVQQVQLLLGSFLGDRRPDLGDGQQG